MERKELFEPGSRIRIEYMNGQSTRISVDYLYQAFKRRLIDELRTQDVPIGNQITFYSLIDATEQG